ncbi:MAG: DUF1127 domain-containing protein [Azospirillum sp.]|nr:DUF1127 domain-containing protein [Azospirillum sp.]
MNTTTLTIHSGNHEARRFSDRLRALFTAAGEALVRLHDQISTWSERTEQRRYLSGMPDHLLRDIGLSRADLELEAGKPFWQA